MIEPIIEYLPLLAAESKRGAAWEIFSEEADDGGRVHYFQEVKDELKQSSGIYVFYDSMARAIYVGKAEKQNLWSEVRNAFNRDRGQHQTIFHVEHPLGRNVQDANKYRRISSKPLKLYDLAYYFSAYRVTPEFIPHMEAFLIRAFANNLMNGRIENFPNMKAE